MMTMMIMKMVTLVASSDGCFGNVSFTFSHLNTFNMTEIWWFYYIVCLDSIYAILTIA
jgi:hypothetical protein